MKLTTATLAVCLLAHRLAVFAAEIEPTWESMAAKYQPPGWFQDGKIGVWMHWGIPSAIDENRPNAGSHYGRRRYGDKDFAGPATMQSEMTRVLHEWHVKRYGPVDQFGYDYRAAADALGVPVGTAASRVASARARLRAALRAGEEAAP